MKRKLRGPAVRRHRGMTLIELLVALGLGLIVVLVATAFLTLAQQGYRAVDTSTDLRDRERFATDLLSRVIVQAGYQDYGAAKVALRSTDSLSGNDTEPDIYGWNNAVFANPAGLTISTTTNIANENRTGSSLCAATDTSCKNGSDILVIRFQGVNSSTTATMADNTMLNCAGQGERGLTTGDQNERAASVFHVTRGTNGEPSLSCSYYKFATSGAGWVTSTPLIEGVESFQVLYGTDGVTAATVPSTAAGSQDTVAERWLRADQLTVTANAAATRENWRRVRAVRIGMVLRGAPGSAQQSTTATFAPLGSLYASSSDIGSSLSVAADGRLRLASTFTVHLRNDLTLR